MAWAPNPRDSLKPANGTFSGPGVIELGRPTEDRRQLYNIIIEHRRTRHDMAKNLSGAVHDHVIVEAVTHKTCFMYAVTTEPLHDTIDVLISKYSRVRYFTESTK